MTNVADKLREAKALIERGWCQQKFQTHSPSGSCFCAVGAIYYATSDTDEQTEEAAIAALRQQVGAEETSDVFEWNDAPERTRAEVLDAFDKAIAELSA